MLEKDVMSGVKRRLEIYKQTGEVINAHRLNSGTVRNSFTGSWVRLGDKDTPDWLALIRGNNNEVIAVYIECKSPTGKLTAGQSKFADKFNKLKDIFVLKVTHPKQLDDFIKEYAIDTVKSLPDMIG